jgi:hypothetical protein
MLFEDITNWINVNKEELPKKINLCGKCKFEEQESSDGMRFLS